MKGKILLIVFMLVSLVLLPCPVAHNTAGSSSPAATVYVFPKENIKPVCTPFDINIKVDNVENLYEFTIKLRYNATIVNATDAVDGGFLHEPRDWRKPIIDRTEGSVQVRGFSYGNATSVSGNGTLAIIKLKCLGQGNCSLTLQDVELKDPQGGKILPVNTINGTCNQVVSVSETIPINESYTLCTDLIFTGPGDLFSITASNVVLDLNGSDLIGYHTGTGVAVNGQSNVCIRNGNIFGFQYGFDISNCGNVSILNVNVGNSERVGTQIIGSRNLTIVNSTVSDSTAEGIFLDGNSSANISNNTISNNGCGISLKYSNNSIICDNTISDNAKGIYLKESSQNIISNNNFTKNKNGHYESVGSTNTWDLGYPWGGNFWDDWNTARPIQSLRIVDETSGKNHTIPGPDGIGDTAYNIDDKNRDQYPLMNPCGSMLQVFGIARKTTRLPVAVYGVCSITGFNFNKTLGVSFKVSGGTFCRVIVSKELIDGAFKILIDDNLTACITNWDDTHKFMDFSYSSGSHKVGIEGEIKIIGDVNGDGEVNMLDISRVARHFGESIKDP